MQTQMTLGKKLAACFAAISLITAVLGVSSWTYIAKLKSDLDRSADRTAKRVEILSDIKNTVLTFRLAERGILLFSSIQNTGKVRLNQDLFTSSTTAVAAKVRELRPMLETGNDRQSASVIESGVSEYVRYQAMVAATCAAGRVQDAIQMDAEHLVSAGTTIVKSTDELLASQRAANTEIVTRARSMANTSRTVVVVLFVLALVLSGVAAAVIKRTTRELQGVARQLGDGAEQISGAAAQVASSSQSLAQGSSEQAASLEETSASSAEIDSVTRQNAANSRTAAESMQEQSRLVEEANHHLAQMVTSMDEINASSGKISKIIKVIDEIAFQTNILALNAAVEAARAGEAGMGFAVVADEVRNLAQRCAQAARDTTGLIEESIARSSGGKTKLDLVAAAVRSITASAGRVKHVVDEVNAGSGQQALGIEQVTRAIQQMEKVTQTIAASAEESASASEELSAQSESLKSVARRLRTMVGASVE